MWEVLLPFIDPTKSNSFEFSPLLSGVFFCLVGWGLLKRKESEREFAFWSLFLSFLGLVLVLGLIFPPDSDFAIHIKLFERPLFDSENNYAVSIIFMLFLVVINSLILIFLGQKETKKLFTPTTSDSIETNVNTRS